jgi:translation initiation factor 3 subunit B
LLIETLEKKPVSHLYWSPQGGFIVLAGLGNLNGVFEFFNANELESMGIEEHFNASVVEWDPTGRYIATVVSHWRHEVGFVSLFCNNNRLKMDTISIHLMASC